MDCWTTIVNGVIIKDIVVVFVIVFIYCIVVLDFFLPSVYIKT